MNEKTTPFRERRALIGQFARASHVDSAWLGRGLGRGIVNLIGGGVAGTNKDRTRPAAAVSSTAARAPDGELDVQLGSSVDFSRSVPLAGCLAAASREETDPHFSEKCELTLVCRGARPSLPTLIASVRLCGMENGALQQLQRRGELPPRAAPRPDHPQGGGQYPTLAPATAGTSRAGQGRRGPTFIAPILAEGAPHAGLGLAEPGRGRRWGMELSGRGLNESVLGSSGKTVRGASAS